MKSASTCWKKYKINLFPMFLVCSYYCLLVFRSQRGADGQTEGLHDAGKTILATLTLDVKPLH